MRNPFLWFVFAILISPAIAYFVYRLARELGFLDPPVDRQHELKRTIVVSLFAFLLLVPVGIYGTEKGWPRVWVFFGVVVGLALAFFAAGGIWATRQLWKLRHPELILEAPSHPQEPDAGAAENGGPPADGF